MTRRRQLAASTCAALVACARPSPWVAPSAPLAPTTTSLTAAATSDDLTIRAAPTVLRGQCFVRPL